uniref:Cytoplasmic tRNA 2-thiolation protein 2 n=1 Tax=Bionectria ochroleuca TaxID=29856 RepID=A0A8H7N348_BIOOC
MPASTVSNPCARCKAEDAPFQLRTKPTCGNCFTEYIETKFVKRLAYLHKEVRTSSHLEPRRYVAGLSFGPSSSALVHLLDGYTHKQSKKKSSSTFEILAVHVDTDLSCSPERQDTPAQALMRNYSAKYTQLSFRCVHLSKVLDVQTVDWSALPLPRPEDDCSEPSKRLQQMFEKLPSVSSRADVLRLLVRHLLLDIAMQDEHYNTLLFGHTTTALAALSLCEVANGRGFAIPWQVNDGRFPVTIYDQTSGAEVKRTTYPIHYPLRELFKGEIDTYISVFPEIAALNPPNANGATATVVSHKDTSIEEVMARYFESVETPHAGIVANVVRTTGKLDRANASGTSCGLCGVVLDERGDSRWAGEMGDDYNPDGEPRLARLCYGCKRSVNG